MINPNVTVIIGYERFEAEIKETSTRTSGIELTTTLELTFNGSDGERLTQAVNEYPPKEFGMKIEGSQK